MNVCGLCKLDFGSVTAFDQHKVGVHAYTLAEGLRMSPPREDGRRCKDTDELTAAGWKPDRHGRWRTPGPRVDDLYRVKGPTGFRAQRDSEKGRP